MSSSGSWSRRGVLATLAASAGGGAALAGGRSDHAGPQTLVLFDPTLATARRLARTVGANAKVRPIQGDRIRLMQALLSGPGRPAAIVGAGRYADYLLLTDCAAEAGYRLVPTASPAPGGRLGSAVVSWIMRDSRTTRA